MKMWLYVCGIYLIPFLNVAGSLQSLWIGRGELNLENALRKHLIGLDTLWGVGQAHLAAPFFYLAP